MASREVIQAWWDRLAATHRRLSADPGASDAWLAQVRLRILAFLLSRYGDGQPGAAEADAPQAMRESGVEALAAWRVRHEGEVSGAYPARTGRNLSTALSDIKQVNLRKRASFRFW